MPYELLIALRYLRSRRKSAFISITTFFTAIGVMIGVAALTITLAVMTGFEDNLRNRVLSMTPHVQVIGFGGVRNYAQIETQAKAIPGVTAADAFIVGQAMLSSITGARGVIVRGIDPSNSGATAQLRRYLREGSISSLEIPPVLSGRNTSTEIGAVAIGDVLAQKLRVKLGDQVRLISPIISASGAEITATSAAFKVGAIFSSGIQFLDDTLTFMNLQQAQVFFGRPGRADGVEVHLADLNLTKSVAAAMRNLFTYPKYRVRTWMEINQAASAGFAMLKTVYSLVLTILIGVAAFNLVAMLIMVVMEKRKDIAILMTMGAPRGAIRRIFILKGLVVGGIGTAAGLVLGACGCFALARYHFVHLPKDIYGMETLPVAPSAGAFIWVAAAALALCLMAALYPARQASRQLPVEVIRWE